MDISAVELANNTKALRILNYSHNENYIPLWGKKATIICDYSNRLRLYYALSELGAVGYPFVIDGNYQKKNLFKKITNHEIDEALRFIDDHEPQQIDNKNKFRPTLSELKKAFWEEEKKDKNSL